MVEQRFEQWKSQVSAILEQRVCASWAELCGEDEPLLSSFDEGLKPEEFCEWFIRKYDLIELAQLG